jgi:hypothetical protein
MKKLAAALVLVLFGLVCGLELCQLREAQCKADREVLKLAAKQGVHEFLNEFGLQYKKKGVK